MANPLQSFIADGFADDIDELVHQCLIEVPVTFQGFAKVFRRTQMSCIFHDRQSGAEIAELSEEVINMAKYYMVANTGNFEESVVGLFLVYALVHLQPFQDFAYLRVIEDDVPYIERIEQVARRDKRIDVLYVLGKLLVENTRYYAASRERGMEPAYRKYLEGCATIENLGMRPKGVFLRQNEELDIIKELSELQLKYDSAKAAIKAVDLNYTDKKFADRLNSSLQNVIHGIHDTGLEGEEEEDAAISTRSIKERAMKAKVNPMKHLMGVEDRPSTTTSTRVSTISDIKSPPGKVKTGSPTKTVTPKSTITKPPPRALKRKRKSYNSSDTTEESDATAEGSDHDSEGVDINLDIFDKEQSKPAVNIEPDEQVIVNKNINFGALPCFVTSDDNGKTYEIEIIDKLQHHTNDESDIPSPRQVHFTEVVSSDSDIPSVAKNTRKEKRDLKKTILKSRFKRMGIEPIANFKAS